MPRKARERSFSKIYHVVMRGVNRQIIFEDERDYNRFIKILKDCKDICGYKIHAFCLMSNHIHLLIEEGEEEDIGKIVKRLLDRYVVVYNKKYRRIGPLFQGRFISEPIDSDEYFVTAARYIFMNPVKAGIVDDVAKYRWSNYNAYWCEDDLTDTEKLKSYFESFGDFDKFMHENDDNVYLDEKESKKIITDEEALIIAQSLLKDIGIQDIAKMEKKLRDYYLRILKKGGLGAAAISRLTGVSKSIVSKA